MTSPPPDQDGRTGVRRSRTAQPRRRKPAPPPERYENATQFFDQALSVLYARDTERTQLRWCPQWQQHPEARARVHALWRAFEQAARDDTMTMWWDAADRMMGMLLAADGTYARCTDGNHNPLPPLS